MTGCAEDLSVLLLTEDASKQAYPTIRALARSMLKLLVEGVHTQHIGFRPVEDEQAERALHGNKWKSRNSLDEQAIRQLVRTIATQLLKPNGYVLFHVDGDRPWSRAASSENAVQFESFARRVAAAVRFGCGDADRAVNRMKRLRLVMPFYSIEAWLYQNTVVAKQLCMGNRCGKCVDKLTSWETDRRAIDEIEQPKDALCLADKHNAELAEEAFPAVEAQRAGASFAHAVDTLRACGDLVLALEATLFHER